MDSKQDTLMSSSLYLLTCEWPHVSQFPQRCLAIPRLTLHCVTGLPLTHFFSPQSAISSHFNLLLVSLNAAGSNFKQREHRATWREVNQTLVPAPHKETRWRKSSAITQSQRDNKQRGWRHKDGDERRTEKKITSLETLPVGTVSVTSEIPAVPQVFSLNDRTSGP